MDNMIVNIFPSDFKEVQLINDFNYTFLDFLNTDDYNRYIPYYNLLNSVDIFKLKNIYHFTFLRTIKLHNQFESIQQLKKINNIDPILINDSFIQYINNEPLKAILIMNSIQQYFYPIKNI